MLLRTSSLHVPLKSETDLNENRPQSLLTGMNQFLASLEITFRRDPTNYRPRVNKMNSVKDKEQKCASFSSSFEFSTDPEIDVCGL